MEGVAQGRTGDWGEVVTRYPYENVGMDHLLSMEFTIRKKPYKNFGAWRKQIVLGSKLLIDLFYLVLRDLFLSKKNFEFCSLKT